MARFDTCRVALVLLGAQGLAGQAPAVPRNAVLMQHTLTARAAEIVARAALEACTNQGFPVAVAITDADGELMVMLRGDGAGVHLLDAARRKAFTAASSGARTSAWEKAVDERSGVPDPHIVDLQNVLVVGGGVPILFGKERIGGIGVSGSPGVRYDEDCADTGLRAVDGLDEHVNR